MKPLKFLALHGTGRKLPRWTWWALGGVALLLLTRREVAVPEKPTPKTGGSQAQRLAQLHPELAKRWTLAAAEYKRRYPDKPQPFLTWTYRSMEEQDRLYREGKYTRVPAGKSLHNYVPALAFDIAFKRPDGTVNYQADEKAGLFNLFAQIAKRYGLAWGGDWSGFSDKSHFEPPNYNWQKAAAKIEPSFPPVI